MIEEQENQSENNEHKPSTVESLNKALAILFVLLVYGVIFLKILFLK